MRWLALLFVLLACGSPANILRGGSSGTTACTGAAANTPGGIAACQTWQNNILCQQTRLGDYYWEIGNATTVLVAGQTGTLISRTTVVPIASASKMLYGAYRAQVLNGIANASTDEIDHNHQTAGYLNGPDSCSTSGTVLTCLTQANSPGNGCTTSTGYTFPSTPTPITVASNDYGALCPLNQGTFGYAGTEFQTGAVFDGLSSFYNNGLVLLANAMNSELNLTSPNVLTYSSPLLAGGANGSAATYAAVLQQIVAGTLQMAGALGAYEVCTNYYNNPSIGRNTYVATETAGNYVGHTLWNGTVGSPFATVSVTNTTQISDPNGAPNGPMLNNGVCCSGGTGANACSTSTNQGSSPIPENWGYSWAHWVEDDPAANGDGAFSSAGSFGFYPWISADKTLYGEIARHASGGQGFASAQCGRLIRHAYVTGIQQTGTLPTS